MVPDPCAGFSLLADDWRPRLSPRRRFPPSGFCVLQIGAYARLRKTPPRRYLRHSRHHHHTRLEHPRSCNRRSYCLAGHIIAEDSRFEGLRIAGEEVKVTLRHNLLVGCKTFDALTKAIASDAKSG